MIYISLIHLTVHVQTVHKRRKEFQCGVCGDEFGSKYDVQRHERAVHDYKSWKCSFCSEIFKRESLLKKHNVQTHSKMKESKYPSKKFITNKLSE